MANWLRLWVAAALLLGIATGSSAQADRYPSLAGLWEGSYTYREGSVLTRVTFEIQLAQRGQSLTGRLIEPNTFKRAPVKFLSANLVGIIDGDRVRLIKTYDGTGGENHSVYYEGKLNANASEMTGTWIVERNWRGEFRAERR